MPAFDLSWFAATLFGPKFPALTQEQFDFVLPMAESELASVLCWCPKLYPGALQMKIALLLEGMQIGEAVASPAPTTVAPGGNYEAYVQEDEVFDVRRKYKIVEKPQQVTNSTVAGQLEEIISRCKPPLGIGATLAAGARGIVGSTCCSENSLGDKAEWNHGGQ